MRKILSPEQAATLPDSPVRQRILMELSRLLADFPGTYNPAQHGWFLVLEQPDDLHRTIHPASTFTPLDVLLQQRYEWLSSHVGHYEAVWIIDGCEAVTLYLPDEVTACDTELCSFLTTHAVPDA